MSKKTWGAMRDEYKKFLKAGKDDAKASDAAYEAASAAAAAASAAEAAMHQLPRIVVRMTNIGRGNNIKALRKEISTVFSALAPVDYVDYGVSNSGDPTVAYVRMKSPEGAAEAARALEARKQLFGGKVADVEVISGAELSKYTQKISELRRKAGKVRQEKRNQWWERKWGKKRQGGEEDAEGEGAAEAEGEAEGGAAESADPVPASGKRAHEEASAGTSTEASADVGDGDGGSDPASKRQKQDEG